VLDIKLIRENPDFVRQRLATRGAGDEKLVDGILQTDEQRRKLLVEVEALKSQRNRVSKEIGALMGQKKIAEAEAKKAETRTGRQNRRVGQTGCGKRDGTPPVDAAPAQSAARICPRRQNRRRQS
jgi:seryl-tRNA synthetase